MSSFVPSGYTDPLRWQIGLETDIGGGRENQDDCFVWIKKDDSLVVLCVLDGHGREVGKVAAQSAKDCLFQYLDENYKDLISNSSEFLIKCHQVAHESIKTAFTKELERQNYEVKLSEEGYLLKRIHPEDPWSCIHGGTSCSMVALVGNTLFMANVGDSTGILCSSHPVFDNSCIQYIKDAADGEVGDGAHRLHSANSHVNVTTAESVEKTELSRSTTASSSSAATTNSNIAVVQNTTKTLVITAEHSPESVYEYKRLQRYRQRADDASIPALLVVYDSNSHDKSRCYSVFDRNEEGEIYVTGKGSYYKNVRKEWASLVSTPSYARFQDALAFTRSLGDLHLHTYGVTHLPEVVRIDLLPIFEKLNQREANPEPKAEDGVNGSSPGAAKKEGTAVFNPETVEQMGHSSLCLVLATDGVWDNWLYEDVNRFVMDASCVCAVAGSTEGARRVTMSFMQRNSAYGKRNFGNQADNATGIVMYLSNSPSFPM